MEKRMTEKTQQKKERKRITLGISWLIFIIAVITLLFLSQYWYKQSNQNITVLFSHSLQIKVLAASYITLLFVFFLLLFFTHKKIAIIITVLSLLCGNMIAYSANDVVASLNNLFQSTQTNAPSSTVISTTKKDILTEPFTILITGVDAKNTDTPVSSSTVGNTYHSDTMLLVTINPKTHKADVITTPRDTFLYDACSQTIHKLTEFIGGGRDCLFQAISDLYRVKIDYFIQVNFTAVVQIVDQLGGIEFDVPNLTGDETTGFIRWTLGGGNPDGSEGPVYKIIELGKKAQESPFWCESDSSRNPYAVCFNQFGKHTIDGEHALALARTRHYDSDYARGIRQADVARSIIQKIATPTGLLQLKGLFESLQSNFGIETNLTFNEMQNMMAYTESLSGTDTTQFQVQKLQPLGTPSTDTLGSGIYLYRGSVAEIQDQIDMTLENKIPSPTSKSDYYDILSYPTTKTNE